MFYVFVAQLSREYSNHGLPDYVTHGENQQEAMCVVENNGQQNEGVGIKLKQTRTMVEIISGRF